MTKKPVINIDEVLYKNYKHGDNFEGQSGSMGNEIGAQQIGCRLMIVPPGKRGSPYHNHRSNEEMFYIIEGTGIYRFGYEEYSLKAGDLITAPAGDNDTAHQIVNNSNYPLKYLSMSTMNDPDVIEYPESGKVGIVAGKAPGEADNEDQFIHFSLKEDGVEYWYGED